MSKKLTFKQWFSKQSTPMKLYLGLWVAAPILFLLNFIVTEIGNVLGLETGLGPVATIMFQLSFLIVPVLMLATIGFVIAYFLKTVMGRK